MTAVKENVLKLYSNNLLKENPEIKLKRKICTISDIINNATDFSELNHIHTIYNFKYSFKNEYDLVCKNEVVYTTKENKTGDSMKWHCDDASIISHNSNLINHYDSQIKISEKKSLYYVNKIPKYSLIIYGSTYNQDFTGGVIEFSDGYKIKPVKNMCLIFDSREAHCVHRIRSGKRKLILIKFY